MPGFGDPFNLDMHTFMQLRQRAVLIGKIACGQADDKDVMTLEGMADG